MDILWDPKDLPQFFIIRRKGLAMYPEDRVLVAYMPSPGDFELLQRDHWYRIPQLHAPKGLHAEYYAFYFGSRFGSKKWAIHFFARQQGHELVARRSMFPDQPQHPRADDLYYEVQVGALQAWSGLL